MTVIATPDLDALLFQALRAIYQFERTKVERFALTYEEIYLLQYLRRNSPARMQAVSREMRKPISTATRLMDRLEKRRLVGRGKAPEDGRGVRVFLTPEGEATVRTVEDHTRCVLAANLARFTENQVAAFMETARHMGRILSVPPDDGR